jgi:hypothetical protein
MELAHVGHAALLASPPLISGSTAWHGAFRFRQYLTSVKPADGEQPDDDLRELRFLKNQYGPRAESVVVRYQNGLFLPEPGMASLDKLAREAKADEVFLELLTRFGREGRNGHRRKSSRKAGDVGKGHDRHQPRPGSGERRLYYRPRCRMVLA